MISQVHTCTAWIRKSCEVHGNASSDLPRRRASQPLLQASEYDRMQACALVVNSIHHTEDEDEQACLSVPARAGCSYMQTESFHPLQPTDTACAETS